MENALRRDLAGFRAAIEVAMIVLADVCVQKSHMVDGVGNPLRKLYGKPFCDNPWREHGLKFDK